MAAFEKAVGPADGARAIHRRAQQDGYLFCPGLAPLATVDPVRALAVDVATDLGWLDRRARRNRAMSVSGVRLGAYDDPRWIEFLRVVLRHRLFGALREEPTVAHQDHFYLPGKGPRWTTWVPLGDCPLSLGPLAILPRSHRRGLLPHSGDSDWRKEVNVHGGAVWAAQDLKAGDVLFFNWLTVHRALPNRRGRELRISATCRYRAAPGP